MTFVTPVDAIGPEGDFHHPTGVLLKISLLLPTKGQTVELTNRVGMVGCVSEFCKKKKKKKSKVCDSNSWPTEDSPDR